MTTNFLGTGWRLAVDADAQTHEIAMVSDEACVQQAIWMILSTAPGERIMRPDFGCGIHNLVFAPSSAETASLVASLVRQALTRWEPRIDLLDVTANPDATDPQLLLITIEYQIRATNSRANLVYPFYLE